MAANTAPSPRKKDIALAFIMERIAKDGVSPSLREISRELAVSVARVQVLLRQLEADGAIERTSGSQRSLRVCDVARSRQGLTEVLRRLGFHDPARPFAHEHLPMLPEPEHIASIDWPGATI